MPQAAGSRPITFSITGHRLEHAGLKGRIYAVTEALNGFTTAALEAFGPDTTIKTMLGDGVDQIATRHALDVGWSARAILPFGAPLTCAMGASRGDETAAQRQTLIEDARAATLTGLSSTPRVQAFCLLHQRCGSVELSERDAYFEATWIEFGLSNKAFVAEVSLRYAMAAKLGLEASDFLLAVWDGGSTTAIGGTGHTVTVALGLGVPVLWIEPSDTRGLRLASSMEDLQLPSISVADALRRISDG